jgi:hypothetical protein
VLFTALILLAIGGLFSLRAARSGIAAIDVNALG